MDSVIKLDPLSMIAEIILLDEYKPEMQAPLVHKATRALTDLADAADQLYRSFQSIVECGKKVPVLGFYWANDIVLAQIVDKLDKEKDNFYRYMMRWFHLIEALRSARDNPIFEECPYRSILLSSAELRQEMFSSLDALKQIREALQSWKLAAFQRVVLKLGLVMVCGMVVPMVATMIRGAF